MQAKRTFNAFSAIEDAVLSGTADLGVIIHENRFTYQQRGTAEGPGPRRILGRKMKAPIRWAELPSRRSLDRAMALQVQQLIRESLEQALHAIP